MTALMMASVRGHASIVEILIKRGADVNGKDYRGKSVLSFATLNGNSKNSGASEEGGCKGLGSMTIERYVSRMSRKQMVPGN